MVIDATIKIPSRVYFETFTFIRFVFFLNDSGYHGFDLYFPVRFLILIW